VRGFRRFVALIVFLGVAWATIPFFVGGRDKDSEDRLLGALNFVQEIIEDSYAEARKVDVFNSPSMDPQPQPNVWSVSGSVAIQDLAGTTIHEPYITIVENLCQAYAERRCWRLERLTIGDLVRVDQKGTTRAAPRTVTAAVGQSTVTPLPAAQGAGTRPSKAPRAAPPNTPSRPSTAGVRPQREEVLALLIQSRLEVTGIAPGPPARKPAFARAANFARPSAAASPPPAATDKQAAPAAADKQPAPVVIGADSSWGIQVGAYYRYNAAKQTAMAAAEHLPGLLKDSRVAITYVKGRRGRIYLSQLVELTRAKARAACRRLERAKIDCVVVQIGRALALARVSRRDSGVDTAP